MHFSSHDWRDVAYNVAGAGDANGDGTDDAAMVAKTYGDRFVVADVFLARARREMMLKAGQLRGLWIYDDTKTDPSLPLFAGGG